MRFLSEAALIVLLSVLSVPWAWASEWRYQDVARVVAIADIHGDYAAMIATLQQADVVDDVPAWKGGGAHLVIVGDILDRGPDSRAAMDFLMRLESEAKSAGGQVHVLIGNHESMLLTGDLRYVSDAEYAAFSAEEGAAERSHWFERFVERQPGDAATLRPVFEQKFPPGYFAMRRAFRPDGRYGKWLLQKNIIEVINNTAFVHGGLAPFVERVGLSGVNNNLQQELVDYVNALTVLTDAEILLPTDSHYDYAAILDAEVLVPNESSAVQAALKAARRLQNSALLGSAGPLWYRGNVSCPGIVEEHRLKAVLTSIGVDRVVVGHTPTPTRQVLQRFDGRIIEIDTGMFGAHYNGSGNALILNGDDVSVVNQSGAPASTPLPHPRRVGRRAADLASLQLETLLQRGEVVPSERLSKNESLVTVSDGTHTVSALFGKRRSKGFYPGVAAYRLDRLLRLDMVPVTVMRQLDGADGSLQFLPQKRTDEAGRSGSGLGGGALCSLADQWGAMYVFDVLIYNEARSQQRMLYDPSTWQLLLSENRRAFAIRKGRPATLAAADFPISAGWRQSLTELTDEVLTEKLADVLSKRRLRSLAARRDELLATP